MSASSNRSGVRVDGVDHLPQAAEVMAIELEDEAWESDQMGIIGLGWQGLADFDPARLDDIGEFGVQPIEQPRITRSKPFLSAP